MALALAVLTPIQLQSAEPAGGKPTDTEINVAVDNDLLFDSSVPSNEIDVMTAEGIVILSGSAPNILAKERATTIAEAVKGVRAVVNNITVTPVMRSDEEVRKDVENALLTDPATDSYELKTEVKNGVVTLTGTVDSYQEKQLSATVAKGVKGVKAVKNDIIFVYKSERPDSEIAAEVREILKNDIWVDALFIITSVKDGKVTLTGTVGSAAEKTRATSDAWTAGVEAVNAEELKVEPWAKDKMKKPNNVDIKSDDEIKKAVKDAFLYDPRVFSFNPDISVSGGIVTLTGIVDNLKAKRAAEQDAKNTAGVWRVKNYLRVRGENPPSDDKLVENVQDALKRDPYLERYQLGVSVLNGAVYLTGIVDSYFDKTHAEDVASRVNGITDIHNSLIVSFPAYGYYFWPYSYHYEPYYYNRPAVDLNWTYKNDAEIQSDIGSQLFWSPFVDRDQVNITVNNGVATLTGTVDSWNEYNAATENAWQGGARSVINKLKVK